MRAFNQRFAPKDFGGIPLPAAIASLIALSCGVLSLMLPGMLKIPVLLGCAASICFAVFCLKLGDEWPFRTVMALARRERHGVTSETRTRY
jgi:hypothetical protein